MADRGTGAGTTMQFKLPDLGEGVKEGQVLRLLVPEGARVEEDQLLLEVETDKSAVEIPSPFTGVVERWHVKEQQVVNVGDVMVTITDGAGAGAPAAAAIPAGRAAAAAGNMKATPHANATTASRPRPLAPRRPASPAVRKLARQRGIDLETITGSGPGGRILRADLDGSEPRAAPAATSVPSAPRIATPRPPAPAPGTITEPPGRDDKDAYGPVKRETISQTRRAIAATMSHAMSVIPHVTDCDDADVTDLDRMRRGYNETAATEGRLSLLPFVVRAIVRGLQTHPIFNATFDEATGEIVYKRYYHVAVGVQTERGLVAPVLRDAERLAIPEIGQQLGRLAERARAGKLGLDDTRGATYTISNAGAMGGSRYATPIITPPQVAVLAVGRSRLMPWVVEGAITPRLIMPLSHSMDHRIIDGALEIAFMRQVIGELEHPGRLML